jgi:hypothetical protein
MGEACCSWRGELADKSVNPISWKLCDEELNAFERGSEIHHSRLCAVLIDCKTSDVDQAARFWGEALGCAVDPNHPNSRGNYRMLETPPDEHIVEIQRVDHESRVHLDIETDDNPAEVARLEKLGATVVSRLRR